MRHPSSPGNVRDLLAIDVGVVVRGGALPRTHRAGVSSARTNLNYARGVGARGGGLVEQVELDVAWREVLVALDDDKVVRLCNDLTVGDDFNHIEDRLDKKRL